MKNSHFGGCFFVRMAAERGMYGGGTVVKCTRNNQIITK